jgi:hypothetical protein
MAVTWGEMAHAWPYSTFLIVLNEFCQKFASLSSEFGGIGRNFFLPN